MSPIRFGLVPTSGDARTHSMIDSLVAMLSKETSLAIEPMVATSPEELATALATGQVQFAWTSPTLLLLSSALSSVIPLLSSVRQSVAFFHAILFVRDDSKIATIEDLAGKHAAWVAKTSAAGYIVPRISLTRQGLDPTKLFGKESLLQSHGAVAHAVIEGRADVGATFGVFEGGDPEKPLVNSGYRPAIGEHGVRIIDAAGPIPSDMIVAMPSMSIGERAVLARAMTKLATHAEGGPIIRAIIGAESFEPFSAQSFLELEELLRFGRWRGVAD